MAGWTMAGDGSPPHRWHHPRPNHPARMGYGVSKSWANPPQTPGAGLLSLRNTKNFGAEFEVSPRNLGILWISQDFSAIFRQGSPGYGLLRRHRLNPVPARRADRCVASTWFHVSGDCSAGWYVSGWGFAGVAADRCGPPGPRLRNPPGAGPPLPGMAAGPVTSVTATSATPPTQGPEGGRPAPPARPPLFLEDGVRQPLSQPSEPPC